MLRSFKIILAISYVFLALSVAGIFLSGIFGELRWMGVCAVAAVVLLAITLVLAKNLRIQRMMVEEEYPDEE